MVNTAEQIARGLSKAQRSWMTDRARVHPNGQIVHIMPPSNTHFCLLDRGLVTNGGEATPLGLEVRKILERLSHD